MDITYKTNKKILKGRKKKGGKLGNLENKEPYGEFPGLSFPPHIPDWVLQNPKMLMTQNQRTKPQEQSVLSCQWARTGTVSKTDNI